MVVLIVGYSGKLREKKIALKLRKQGLSYKEIKEKVNVSKDTLSRWCRNIILTPEQLENLQKKKLTGAQKGRFVNSKKQQEIREKETIKLFQEGKKEINNLSDREKFLIGVALYSAEGTKGDRNVAFSNSNPKLIKFMADWMIKYCHIDKEKLRGAIWIHENLDINTAKKFWAKLTGIPEYQFHKTYLAKNKIHSRKIRKNIHPYGVFKVSTSNAKLHRKLMGWLDGIMAT